MKDLPEGVSEPELKRALTRGWDIQPGVLTYVPEGAGSYHWMVQDKRGGVVGYARGGRWFVTVDDLDDKSWLGSTRTAVFAGLRLALNTALALRDQAGLGFVAAPVPAVDGETVWPVNKKYAVAVYPYKDGVTGEFGQPLPARARAELVGMLAALHQVVPTSQVPAADTRLPLRGVLEAALGQLDRPWTGGPFSEAARLLLAGEAGPIGDLRASFDQLTDQLTAGPDRVITHGEPHPANLMVTDRGPLLIDWDTVGLARPERDLWWVLGGPGDPGDTSDEARRYTEATGRAINPDALSFYRIRWTLG